MRTDDKGFKLEPGAAEGLGVGLEQAGGGQEALDGRPERLPGLSQSGRERNHLFLNQGDGQFRDISGISVADSAEDGRSFAVLDYDRDGWLDMVVVNSNAPTTLLYRNQLGDADGAAGETASNQVLALRFVGSHRAALPGVGRTARDGYGALVQVDLGATTLTREYRCGEGLAAQNSSTLLVGIGNHARADRLRVRWPSGIALETQDVPAGSLVTLYEDASQSPSGTAFAVEPYVRGASGPAASAANRAAVAERLVLPSVDPPMAGVDPERPRAPALVMYTTMATWCASCRKELPELARLRAEFAPEELRMLGVPVDPKEGPEELVAYAAQLQPAYELQLALTPAEVAAVKACVARVTPLEALPATVLTDADGNVLLTRLGAPSISDLRRLLRSRSGGPRTDPIEERGNPSGSR